MITQRGAPTSPGEASPPPLPHEFRDLCGRYQHTAAQTVPLLMWRDTQGAQSPPLVNLHRDFFSLYIVRRGRGTHLIEGAAYGISRGDVYVMGPGMQHQFTDCDDLLTDTLHFSPAIFDACTLDALEATPGFHGLFVAPQTGRVASRWLHLSPDALTEISTMTAELEAEWRSGTADGTLLTPGLFLRLLIRLSRFQAASAAGGAWATPRPSWGTHDTTIAAAVRYLDENFAQPVRVEQLAALVFLSPHRFTEVFAATMGRTPRDYLRHVRIERAKTLLTTTDATSTEIAQAVGLGEATYLTRVLREATGLTPRQWRLQNAAGAASPAHRG